MLPTPHKVLLQKSGDGREDVEKPSVYKHSEHLRFLDGIAIGNFGTQPTVTNVAENNTAEADLQRQESVHIDLEAEVQRSISLRCFLKLKSPKRNFKS